MKKANAYTFIGTITNMEITYPLQALGSVLSAAEEETRLQQEAQSESGNTSMGSMAGGLTTMMDVPVPLKDGSTTATFIIEDKFRSMFDMYWDRGWFVGDNDSLTAFGNYRTIEVISTGESLSMASESTGYSNFQLYKRTEKIILRPNTSAALWRYST